MANERIGVDGDLISVRIAGYILPPPGLPQPSPGTLRIDARPIAAPSSPHDSAGNGHHADGALTGHGMRHEHDDLAVGDRSATRRRPGRGGRPRQTPPVGARPGLTTAADTFEQARTVHSTGVDRRPAAIVSTLIAVLDPDPTVMPAHPAWVEGCGRRCVPTRRAGPTSTS